MFCSICVAFFTNRICFRNKSPMSIWIGDLASADHFRSICIHSHFTSHGCQPLSCESFFITAKSSWKLFDVTISFRPFWTYKLFITANGISIMPILHLDGCNVAFKYLQLQLLHNNVHVSCHNNISLQDIMQLLLNMSIPSQIQWSFSDNVHPSNQCWQLHHVQNPLTLHACWRGMLCTLAVIHEA